MVHFSVVIGHLGDVTVEHVAHHLPIIVRDFLREANEATHAGNYTPESISDLFTKAILAFDDAIAHDVLDLFGGSVDNLANYTDAEIRQTINDHHLGGENWRKVRLCMYGTTALVSLVDPEHKNLWVANLGDCQASECSRILHASIFVDSHTVSFQLREIRCSLFFHLRCDRKQLFLILFASLAGAFLSPLFFCLVLVSPGQDAKDWDVEVLTVIHNGDNDAELERVRKNHPGEPECIVDRRVLGALAPTRCESSCFFIFGSFCIDSNVCLFPHTFLDFVIPRSIRHGMFRFRRHPLQAIPSFYPAYSV